MALAILGKSHSNRVAVSLALANSLHREISIMTTTITTTIMATDLTEAILFGFFCFLTVG